ncbi:MAG: hypothetical protein NC548_15605 [Lachnospiraceae bacterium]|nr:hypothetical protein [Lachnospiraceae bacterium]
MNKREFKRKVIIIINGKGGVGKDTLINFTRLEYGGVSMISAIDPIKEIAKQYGYSENDKNDKARKFLSDLKRVFIEWNELPMQYLLSGIESFVDGPDDILFIHIREKSEIDKLKDAIVKKYQCTKIKLFTLLVKNKRIDDKTFGNESDDDVDNYNYDLIYHNDKILGAAKFDWLLFFEEKVVPYMMTEK